MIQIGGRVEGGDELERLLARARARARDLSPVFRGRVNRSVSEFFTRQFATAGQAGGKPWRPLSARALRRRVRPGGNRGGLGRPLWDFGRLRGSLVKVGPESVLVVRPQRFERGTTVPYGIHHQEGDGPLPVREIVPDPLPQPLVHRWADWLAAYVAEGER